MAAVAPILFLMFWSTGFAVAKVGLRDVEPLTFLALRYALVVLVFAPLFVILRPALPATRMAWLHIAVVGFLIQFVYFALIYVGMGLGVSAGVTAVLTSTQPLVVAVASPFTTGERIGPRRWLGLLLGAAGAITVIVGSAAFAVSVDIGLVFCVLSTFGMAAATLYQKRFATTDTHPVTVNLIHYGIGLVTVVPVAWALESMHVRWTPSLVASVTWLALANSVVALSLLLFMIRRSEASRVSSLFFLVPPMAALVGWQLLGETVTRVALGGMVLAVGGVWLVSRSA